ncbi:ABC transporter permease [Lapidilactobacillus luobeiensis]|uniref:ABC transporter permease n=1 Tax=Lapidilactobacillus luobeiensis TaxID=2950371 RepID=UPI0021C4C1D2|nr:ABC transporter permease [Lapidilactobacillus luobeiensis]
MSDFAKMWADRRRQHLIKQSKYLQYVFNDHLILAFVFLAGALAFWYSNFLQTIKLPLAWAPYLISGILLATLSVGRLATLVVNADQVFLLPREAEMSQYLRRARWLSLILPGALLISVGVILTPFTLRATQLDLTQWWLVVLTLLIFKDLDLWRQYFACFTSWSSKRQRESVILIYCGATLSLLLSFGLTSWWGLLLAGVLWGGRIYFDRRSDLQTVAWYQLIAQENVRQVRLLRFYNLFVDVPEIGGHVVQRRWLDRLIQAWSQRQPGPYRYLFIRAFLRRTDYSNIWLRFVVIGVVLLALIQQPALLLIIALLFLYLTGYQLLPLVHHFDHNALAKLLPTVPAAQQQQFTSVLRPLLLIEWLAYSITILIHLGFARLPLALALIAGTLLFLYLFLKFYLPQRLSAGKKGKK